MKSDKEIIMKQTDGGLEVFRHYLPEFISEDKNFLSPFRSEKTPSANIFRAATGVYLFKDFGTAEALNCIDFIMKRDRLDYNKAVEKIKNDLKISTRTMNKSESALELKISSSPIDYFNDYCLAERTGEYLERYNIFNIESYTHNGHTYRATEEKPIIGFKIADACFKLYQPGAGGIKHMWLGSENKPEEYKNIWGIEQLPPHCDTIVIAEGLKDTLVANMNLNHRDIYAVGVDSVSTQIPFDILELLKGKCHNLLLCYDIDDPGQKSAAARSLEYGLRYATLPDLLKESDGKDISDWFNAGLGIDLLEQAFRNARIAVSHEESAWPPVMRNDDLKQMLEMERILKDRAKNIERPEPLITFEGQPAIIKGTINTIMGKQGSHKSRLAGGFASLICSDKSSIEGGMGFEKTNGSPAHIVYIDTERNSRLEFPPAISAIQSQSGNKKVEQYFHPVSVKEFPRERRLEMTQKYINYLRRETTDHIVVLIDVITDCVSSFNDEKETLNTFDYLGKLAEEEDITIIAVIHQNPGSDKARGHVGTELVNKSSTAMTIGYHFKEDISKGVITLSYVKNRHSKRLPDLLLKYDEDAEMLVALSEEEQRSLQARKRKADLGDVEAMLLEIMPDPGKQYAQQDVVDKLKSGFNCSENTIKNRLKTIQDKNEGKFEGEEGGIWQFSCLSQGGGKTYYTLNKIKEE